MSPTPSASPASASCWRERHFTDGEVDQARAAGVLIEFGRAAPIICDRSLYRELVNHASARTLEELREHKTQVDAGRKRRPR